jgi:hypothetical protein
MVDVHGVMLTLLFDIACSTQWEDAARGLRGETNFLDVLFHVYADAKLAMMLFTQVIYTEMWCNCV